MWWEKKKKTEESINSQSKYQIEFSNIDKRGNGEGKLTDILQEKFPEMKRLTKFSLGEDHTSWCIAENFQNIKDERAS